MNSVLVGMFDTPDAARTARSQLIDGGFDATTISMHPDTDTDTTQMTGTASTGAVHEEGNAVTRFFRNLFDGDDNDEYSQTHRSTYDEAFRRGAYGVTVHTASEAEMEKAERILNAAGAVDIDERASQWRNEGWTGAPSLASDMQTADTVSTGSTQTLQEVQEELKVGKRAVSRGGVRVYSRMVEVPVSESVRLREEHADIQRRVVDRPATEADFSAFKEGEIEVREMAEEAVVSKSARVTGEVEIGKVVTERDETIQDTVRQTKVEIEELVDGTGKMTTSTSPQAMPATTTPDADFNANPLSTTTPSSPSVTTRP